MNFVPFNSLFGILSEEGQGNEEARDPFNSLFGILLGKWLESLLERVSFNSLFGIQSDVYRSSGENHGLLSTPFSGFKRSVDYPAAGGITFNSLFGILWSV